MGPTMTPPRLVGMQAVKSKKMGRYRKKPGFIFVPPIQMIETPRNRRIIPKRERRDVVFSSRSSWCLPREFPAAPF